MFRLPHHPAHRVSTAHLQAIYPGIAQAGIGSKGVYVGRDYHGGSFCYDPWELYTQGELTGPNMLVIGQIGRGKSAFVKTYVWRQLAFGRQAIMLDPKGENDALCAAAGCTPIRLSPGGAVRLNPLDAAVAAGSAIDVLQERVAILAAILGASLGRGLTPEERVALEGAVLDATACQEVPTLRGVVGALLDPSPAAAERARTTLAELVLWARTIGFELRRLVDGDLRGMFDGQTSGGIDLDAPIVSFDLSQLYQSAALGILMVCVSAWIQRLLRRDDGHRRVVVLDEAWAVLGNLEIARWLQASYKLARAYGVQYIAVLHRLSDLTAAGSADSAQVRLARGLLADSETVVVYGQPPSELEGARDLLELNEVELEYVSRLPRGMALWKVGQRSFVVEHVLGRAERAIVDTDARMRLRQPRHDPHPVLASGRTQSDSRPTAGFASSKAAPSREEEGQERSDGGGKHGCPPREAA